MRIPVIAFGILLTLSLLFGNPAHALIAHDHGHAHGAESTMWQTLHSSLRHEDKKILPVSVSLMMLGIVLIASATIIPTRRNHPVDGALRALRRGIVPYRKFG